MREYKKIKEKLAVLSTFPDLPFLEDLTGEDLVKLYDIMLKIENGTLIELPCKVGDTVFWVFELVKNKLEILEGKIRGLSISQNNTSWFSVIYEYGLTFEHTFKDNWNKTVFLTKAEAEKRLQELQK